jgi:hypothetical protein
MPKNRTELQREVVEALVQSKAVDFEATGQVLAKFGARAALTGDAIGVIINWRVMDLCIPVDRFIIPVFDRERLAAGAAEEG